MSISKYDSKLNLNYLCKTKEHAFLERKRAKISPQDLANEIIGFANATGGVLVVGITDEGIVEGFNACPSKLNELQREILNFLMPTPVYKIEIVDVKNVKDEDDKLLIFHIKACLDYVIRNNKDEVYSRQGDSVVKLNAMQVRSLEQDRRECDYENMPIPSATLEYLDEEVFNYYKFLIDAQGPAEEILSAKNYLKKVNDEKWFTRAGALLFTKNPTRFIPSARVRVIKFEGTQMQVGQDINIVKEKTFDSCLYKTIIEASEFIRTQLRDFMHLTDRGQFVSISEYPEFAWYEGLINALVHRDYTNNGNHITVKIFDDHMEIESPGGLGGFVTFDDLGKSRFSRNPEISRGLVEFGVVRELNEGVKRIREAMEKAHLSVPTFTSYKNHNFLLILENNVTIRSKRKKETLLNTKIDKDVWDKLNYNERKIMEVIHDKGEITSLEVSEIIQRGKTTAVKLLNKLVDYDLIEWTGTNKSDKFGKYIFKD